MNELRTHKLPGVSLRELRSVESGGVNIRLPWDGFTARGFAGATVIVLLLVWLIGLFKYEVPPISNPLENTIPIELLRFGKGDGTGQNKGNLTAEGSKSSAPDAKNPLEDAKVAQPSLAKGKLLKSDDPTQSNHLVTKPDEKSEQLKTAQKPDLGATKSQGTGLKGLVEGTGLGDKGEGKGKGLGLGDIEWGGGGNRTVVNKVIPKMPPGVTTGAQIRIRFTVNPDGTVAQMIPLQKGEPLLEKAAMNALRRWQFNKLSADIQMSGTITFNFVLN